MGGNGTRLGGDLGDVGRLVKRAAVHDAACASLVSLGEAALRDLRDWAIDPGESQNLLIEYVVVGGKCMACGSKRFSYVREGVVRARTCGVQCPCGGIIELVRVTLSFRWDAPCQS